MLITYLGIGGEADRFWRSTPREIGMAFASASQRMRREHNDRMMQAWWAGRIATLAEPPKLKDLLVGDRPVPPRQPWQQIKAALMLALG